MNLKETFTSLPAMQAREKIPPHKRRSQWFRTFAGALVFAAGLVAPWKLGFPWQAGLGIAAFGGFMASQQLVTDFLKIIPQAIAAVVGALAGKKEGGWASLPLIAGVALAGGAVIAFLQSPSAAGEFSLGVTIGILLGEALAMLSLPYVIKRFGMSFGAYTEAQQASTAATIELTKLLKAVGEAQVFRVIDEQRKTKEVA